MYVIQQRYGEGDKWETLNERYETIIEAVAALGAKPKLIKALSRIAEEYTVTRYKAVKIS